MTTDECWHGSSSEDKRTARGLEHRDGCRKVPHVGRARLVESQGLRDESPSSNLGRVSQERSNPSRPRSRRREQLGRRRDNDAKPYDGVSRREVVAQVKVSVISKTDSLRTTFEHFARSV